MTGHHPHHGDALERIERLREALDDSLRSARRAIDMTRNLQDSETMQRVAAMDHLERANHALHASAGLID